MTDNEKFLQVNNPILDCNANVHKPCQVPTIETGVKPIMNENASESNISSMDGNNGDGDHQSAQNWLTELAIIATSPQSPLMESRRKSSSGKQRQRHHSEGSVLHKPTRLSAAVNSLNRAIHTYAKPPRNTPPPSLISSSSHISDHYDDEDDFIDPVGTWAPESDARITSSSPFLASPKGSESVGGTWSHPWPTAVWKCFLKGNKIRFTSGPRTEWRLAEENGSNEYLATQATITQDESSRGQSPISGYAPLGLRLVKIEDLKPCDPRLPDVHAEDYDQMKLTFDPDVNGQSCLETICSTDHPFFVRHKGWSSYIPCQTVVRYGIPCSELESGDVCLPPSHPDATSYKESEVLESFKSYDLTPLDSSAVLALSSMARHRKDLENSPIRQMPLSAVSSSCHLSPGGSASAPSSPSKGMKKLHLVDQKGKRPMNAFMLFAKKFRLEYTQLHPDKDNRAISVILGNKWKKMRLEERKVFSQEAKHLADEHKKIHPDCWKRKRAHSTSSVHS
ncbi:HMG box-containing protein 1-like isoform X1 [Lytechinus pictus]|uniref:HMG box-containing protein 1-like isoform X1 n=2 Tax=Lytechinus pictus TaxID=7653 RepID=UPI0030BA1556